MGACLPSTQLLQLPLLYNGLPRGCWSPLVGAHTCPSPGPLPSGCGSPALSGPRRSRAQSSFGQLSASPLSCQSKPSYTRWGLGRAVRGRKKQLRGQSGVRAAGCPPQPPSVGFFGDQLSACFCLSFPLCPDRIVVLLSVLAVGGPWENVRGPKLTHKCPLHSPAVPFSCQAPPASLRKVGNEGD